MTDKTQLLKVISNGCIQIEEINFFICKNVQNYFKQHETQLPRLTNEFII